jgi:aerotolerance regulator-like protein
VTLLAPWALWGLLALSLPLLLHLRRRRVGRTIRVGSIKRLESLPTAERRGVRLREPWLLLLRFVILGALVLLLATLVLDKVAAPTGSVALVDRAASPALRDSLGALGPVIVERVDDPWRRLQELDDSLPSGIPLIIAASNSSDRFSGPRPTLSRRVSWIPVTGSGPRAVGMHRDLRPASPVPPPQARALAAAVAATAEEFGPLVDTAGWQTRLPSWWRDSLATTAFPVAVARALAPAKARPSAVRLASTQFTPRFGTRSSGSHDGIDLHWWIWGLATGLFVLERWLARRRGEAA